ncbi:MAG: hypothetical protein KAS93_03990 [Gammaproteobacteria bacterium]|nr:hypothetical protein [Gammaproteobacteria bacterium]
MSNMQTIHGVLLDVFNTGVLITGNANSGKSELALALIANNHKLVADDAPEFTLQNKKVIGQCPELLRGFMHIRDLGIINISKLYSAKQLKQKTNLELIMHLGDSRKLNRTICGAKVPQINLKRTIATNLTNIAEVAVKDFILKQKGYDANKEFTKKHQQLLKRKKS